MSCCNKSVYCFFPAKIVIQTASLSPFIVIFSTQCCGMRWAVLYLRLLVRIKNIANMGVVVVVAPVYGYCHSLGLPLLLSLLSCKCSSSHLNDILIKYINKNINNNNKKKETKHKTSPLGRVSFFFFFFLVRHIFMWVLGGNKETCF